MRRIPLIAFGLFGLTWLAPAHARGQATRADTAAVLYRVAEDLRGAGYPDDARRLLRVIIERYQGTEAAGEARRLFFELRRRAEGSGGTAAFVAWHTALGAAVGVLIPAAWEEERPAPYGVGLLLGGPLGYGLSRVYTARHQLSSGQALAIDYASAWGMIQFPMWEDILDIGGHEECFLAGLEPVCYEVGGGATVSGALVGALAGVTAGLAVAGTRPVSAGTALSIMFASQWGLYFGYVGSTLAQADGEAALTWTAVGGNLGFLAALVGGPKLRWSSNRTWLVEASGLAGLGAGFGVALIANPDDDEVGWTLTGLGAGLGLAIGAATTGSIDDEGAGGVGIGRSLIERNADGWRIGVPMPRPGILPAPAASTRAFVPALEISLLQAVF